ncbi:MAG: bifunctional riboflavin kinase/FAD synthetase [bacterium]
MKITWGLENAVRIDDTITTIGSYDGVHRGHKKILQRLTQLKREGGFARSLVVTFDPHPQEILRKNNNPISLLTTTEERLYLLEAEGVDETLIIKFSLEFARTPYQDFFNTIICDILGTKEMVVGFNHAFGKNREGDIAHLQSLATDRSVMVEEIPPLVLAGENVSSTKIRHALLDGKVELANEYLGRAYDLTGIVEHGDKIGTELGFATANLNLRQNKIIPADGVYAGLALLDSTEYPAAISIGTRPTVTESGERKIEVHMLDFDKSIYDKQLKVKFLKYIRPQQKFDSYEELSAEIRNDVAIVRAVTNTIK